MEEYILPDEDKIVTAVRKVVGAESWPDVSETPTGAARPEQLELLRLMWRIRAFEERVGQLKRARTRCTA